MMFTRRHYHFIAQVIGATPTPISTTEKFVEALKRDNPRFDEARFIRAVYVALLGEADVSVYYLERYQERFAWAFN